MSRKKCEKGKEMNQKPTHQYICKCGYSSKKKDKLCKPMKINRNEQEIG